MSEEIAAKTEKKPVKRKRPDSSLESGNTKPGDNARYLRQKMEILSWGDIPMSDPVAVEERSKQYIECCARYDMKPTIAGYALALGIERQSLFKYREGQIGKNSKVRDTLKKTCQCINSLMEDYMQNGKINPVAGIFLMKNNMNYADKQEVVVSPSNPMGEAPDQKALEERYIESVVIDTPTE